MENSTKALYIAASVLVAVLILSLVVLLFNKMDDAHNARDKANEEKNISVMNAEYEAFNKKLMYGADVISCINKAISNNKNAKDKKDPDLYIDIWVHLDTDATEEFKICKIVKEKAKTIDTNDEDDKKNVKNVFSLNNSEKVRKLFKVNSNMNSKVNDGTTLGSLFPSLSSNWNDTEKKTVLDKNTTNKSNPDYYYYLLDNGKLPANENDNGQNPLGCLVNTKEEYTWNFSEGGNSYCVKWTTAFKSFRKMAFACTGVEYSENTGRVNKMIFEGREKKK